MAWLDSTDPLLWWDRAEPALWYDSSEAADIADAIDPAEANEPMLANDAKEAALPTERIESWEQIERTEFSDQRDHTRRSVAFAGSTVALAGRDPRGASFRQRPQPQNRASQDERSAEQDPTTGSGRRRVSQADPPRGDAGLGGEIATGADDVRLSVEPGEQVRWPEALDAAVVLGDLGIAQHLAAGSRAATSKEGSAVLQDPAGVGNELVCLGTHLFEVGRVNERRPRVIIDHDSEVVGEAVHLAFEICEEIVVVDQGDIGLMSATPRIG